MIRYVRPLLYNYWNENSYQNENVLSGFICWIAPAGKPSNPTTNLFLYLPYDIYIYIYIYIYTHMCVCVCVCV